MTTTMKTAAAVIAFALLCLAGCEERHPCTPDLSDDYEEFDACLRTQGCKLTPGQINHHHAIESVCKDGISNPEQ